MAAKRRSSLLILIASTLVVFAPAVASSHSALPPKTRVELKTPPGPNRVERLAVSLETASRYYDPFGEVASGSSVAPRSVAATDDLLPILNREFVPDARRVLQNVTNSAVDDLAANPVIARDLMSAGSYRHLVQRTGLADASYGKAVERLAADIVAKDADLSRILRYQSRPFVSTPDFFGYEGYNLRLLDITTENAIPRHLTRPYGPATDYIIHPGLPDNLVFPR